MTSQSNVSLVSFLMYLAVKFTSRWIVSYIGLVFPILILTLILSLVFDFDILMLGNFFC